MREKEVEMNRIKPQYIKSKEETSHVLKRLEASKYVHVHVTCVYACVHNV